jgi:TolB-like protein/predicted Ser/Thr protein kinase
MTGESFGRYRLLEKLGEGGMGVVHKAEDTKLRRLVAIKFLPAGLAGDTDARLRFEREAQAAAALNHPNIVTVYEIDERDGRTYIAMEYVDGRSLKDLLAAGPLPFPDAARVIIQVCEALERAHAAGIVHRDVKPGNVMVAKDGRVKVVDFGLAKLQDAGRLTLAATTLGTVHYMSPEQARGEDVDHRSDLWSLGVMMAEMVSGKLPFTGQRPQAVLRAVLDDEPALAIPPPPAVPAGFADIVKRLLAKSPGDRYARAAEVAAGVRALSGHAGAATATQSIPPVPAAPPAFAPPPALPAVAVLPFKNMSADPENEYFGDGLAEELINALAHVSGLRVAARTSAFSFKGKDMDVRDIGRTLSVGTVLEGSVRRSGKSLRVTAQLIDVADGFHLWSERFDRKMDDIFAIQDEITTAIVEKLKPKLLEGEKERLVKRHTVDKKAYDLFLRGRYFWNRRFKGDMVKAVDYYERAIAQDPGYALPHVGIADVFNILGMWAYIHPQEAYARSKAALDRALAIDDGLGEAVSSLGFIRTNHDWDFATSQALYRRSIALNPSDSLSRAWLSTSLMITGQPEEALSEIQAAVAMDPMTSLYRALLGIGLCCLGRIEEGRKESLQAVVMNPNQPMAHLFQGFTNMLRPALPERAIESLEKAASFGLTYAHGWAGLAYAMVGRPEDARRTLARLEAMESEPFLPAPARVAVRLKPGLRSFRTLERKYVSPLLRALCHIGLGDLERAVAELESSEANRDYFLPSVLFVMPNLDHPVWREAAEDPRLRAIKDRIMRGR